MKTRRITFFGVGLVFLTCILSRPAGAQLITFSTPPEAMAVFGATPETMVTQTSTNQVHCFYDVSAGAGVWSGAGFNWDNFSTPQNEYIDLSSSTALIFAIVGTCTNLKLELEDIYTNKAKYYLTGINPSATRMWTIPASSLQEYFPNFDRSRLRFFFLVATPGNNIGNVGTGNEIGNFTIYVNGGLPFKYFVAPTNTGTLTCLPGNPPILQVGGGNPDTVIRQTTDSTFAVDYSVSDGEWAGVSIPFSRNTYADFSANPSIVLAVSGTPASLKFEVEDMYGARMSAQLYGIPGGVRYYAVDTAIVAGQNIDIHYISYINLVVDKPLAGPATQGTFRVWSLGPAVDTDGDWMPDFVEVANGLDPNSTNNGNGMNNDPDGDGVGNYQEIIAGTAPMNSNSAPILHMGPLGESVALSFDGIAGRKYRFYVCDNLKTGEWTQVGSTEQPTADTPLDRLVAPPPPDSARYYRVRITKD